MNGPLRKDLFRSIKKSFTRFISIVAIIALGISFFVGMKSASPDMRKTANDYFVKNNLMDIEAFSTIGFTSEEIKKISSVEGVDEAQGVKYADTLIFSGETGIVNPVYGGAMSCRVMSMDFKKAKEFCENGTADNSYINRIDLIDGRLPEKKNECVIDYKAAESYSELAIGSVITLSGDGVSLDDVFKNVNYTIVGTVASPMYISFERGTTDIASGTLGMYIFVSESCFVQDTYTSAFAVIDNKASYDVYSDEYKKTVDEIGSKIESFSQQSISDRLADVKKEYSEKIEKGKKDYSALEKETTKQLKEALERINEIQDYIDNGGSDIVNEKKQLEARVKAAEAQLKASKENYGNSKDAHEADKAEARDKDNELSGSTSKAKQIYNDFLAKQKSERKEIDKLREKLGTYDSEKNSAKTAWDRAESSYQSAADAVADKEAQLSDAQESLEKYKKQQAEWTEESLTPLETINSRVREYTLKVTRLSNELDSAKSKRNDADSARSKAKSEYDDAVNKYNALQMSIEDREATYERNQETLLGYEEDIRRLEAGQEALSIFKSQLSRSEQSLLSSKIAITESQLRLYYEESTGNQKITTATANLKAAKTRLEKAEKQYADIEHDVKIELDKAQGSIDKAQLFLDELNSSKWVVSYQNDLPGHESYGQSLESINAMANVFPVFFFVIAAFICLATMTRMVQEERMQMGTLKALGYGTSKILMKYYRYATLACAAGCALGAVAGTLIFPQAINKAYGMMYRLPDISVNFNWFYIICGTVFAFAVTIIATRIACRSELKVQAAHLMRPKAPKPGKRIFLERFTTLWNTLSFGSIVTLRNMFRSKRRMVMTIIGVASCTTLILTAFGLSNSVDKIITSQYGEGGITKYDLMLTLDEAQIPNESETLKTIKKDIRVKKGMLVDSKTMTAYSPDNGNIKITAHVIIPEKADSVPDYFSLRTRKKHLGTGLTDKGIIISEKLSIDTGAKKGDTLILRNSSGDEYQVPVANVAENYLDHYIYISPDLYAQTFGKTPEFKNILLRLENFTAEADEQNLADDLFAYNNVTGISSTDVMIESFNAVIDRLDVIITIFIVAAGLLALIILYNLTNISVQERLREIATIRVLGFTDAEVTSYVYRENIIMTVTGILIGLLGGTILHRAVISIAEVNIAMFGRDIYWWSYALATVITAAFAAVVWLLVHRHLKNLDTIASLKSVE